MGGIVELRQMGSLGSSGHLLQLLRDGVATTRPQLVRRNGASRSAVAQRVDALLEAGLVREDGASTSTGGRPAVRLRFNQDQGVVLVADLGATHARLAVTDLASVVLAERAADCAIADGPVTVLDWVSCPLRRTPRRGGTSPGRRARNWRGPCLAPWSTSTDGRCPPRSCRGGMATRSPSTSPTSVSRYSSTTT